MGGVQWDGDGHGGAGTQTSTFHPGQTEAVEQPEAFHVTVASGVAVLDGAGPDGHQQLQAEPQEKHHYALERHNTGQFKNFLTLSHVERKLLRRDHLVQTISQFHLLCDSRTCWKAICKAFYQAL